MTEEDMSEHERLIKELVKRKNQVVTAFKCTNGNGSIVALMSEYCLNEIEAYEIAQNCKPIQEGIDS